VGLAAAGSFPRQVSSVSCGRGVSGRGERGHRFGGNRTRRPVGCALRAMRLAEQSRSPFACDGNAIGAIGATQNLRGDRRGRGFFCRGRRFGDEWQCRCDGFRIGPEGPAHLFKLQGGGRVLRRAWTGCSLVSGCSNSCPARIGRRAAGLRPDSAIGLGALSWHNAVRPMALGDTFEICSRSVWATG